MPQDPFHDKSGIDRRHHIPSHSSLLRFILFHRLSARIGVVLLSFLAAVFGLLNPLFQKLFVDRLMGLPDTVTGGVFDAWPTPLLIVSAFGLMLLAAASGISSGWLGIRESLYVQGRLGETIYDKMLRMRTDQLGHRTVGEVVSIYATDVPGSTAILDQTLPVGAAIIFPLLFAPLAVYWISGIPLWATSVVMLAIVILVSSLSLRQSRFFNRFKQLAAERTGLVSEWIQNIRLLRILGWTESFEQKIFGKRIEETANRVAMVTNGQLMGSIGSSVSYFINLSGVASLVFLRGGAVSPGELLALLWIFGVFLARPFRQVPWLFTFCFDALTSLRRVEAFLADREEATSLKETRTGSLPPFLTGSSDGTATHSLAAHSLAEEESRVSEVLTVQGLELQIGDKRLLGPIEFSVTPGEFVGVVGEVGSGKSLLLLSLMGETGATFKRFEIGDKDILPVRPDERRSYFSYVPQEGFVMSGTLRENVGLEYGLGTEANEQVLASLARAQFSLDKEKIQGGLETEIGERGVNLSGGQRQRVSLARADLLARPILLLDDCLSAVDIATERRLIKALIAGFWKNRTRILVTHRLTVLEHVDRILFIEGGRIIAQGQFEELLETNEKFRQFAATVAQLEQGSGFIPLPPDSEKAPDATK